ncbi:glycerol dehydratase reactivase beta/small subunit family protein [Clostridium lundense]|uniref:glycerol dehydratase reactivase beta/small subunit family protein n=1 Tax=Clostridium lundense TaxID=319475 RepID=UPI0004843412|nr:glycerol dehydratase reactivase beta/small subunit family protein [Clostridium lundense]
MIINSEKPSINIYVNNGDKSLLTEILAGIEEEGLPFEIFYKDFKKEDLIKGGYTASQESRMGIGIGMYERTIVMHYNKLKESEPIFYGELSFYEREKSRRIGCNAARLYKIMPFKDLVIDLDKKLVESIKLSVIEVLKGKLS